MPVGGAIRAGAAYVEVFIKDNQLTRGLDAAAAKLKDFGAGVAGLGAKISGLGHKLTDPITSAATQFAEAGSNLALMSQRTGVSVEALSTLGYAASQTGTDLDAVETGIKFMSKALVKGSIENTLAAASFDSLGVSAERLAHMKPEKAFEILSARLSSIPNDIGRTAASLAIFSRAGTKLIPMQKNLKALTDEAKEFGLEVSGEAAQDALVFKQSITLLQASIGRLIKTVGSAVAVSWTRWNVAVARNVKTVKDWVAAHKPLILLVSSIGFALVAVGTVLTAVAAGFTVLGTVVAGVSAAIGVLGTVVGALLSPLGLVAAALVGGAVAFFKYTDEGKAGLTALGKVFGGLKADAISAFEGIANALSAGDIVLAAQILWGAIQVEWLKGVLFLKTTWADWVSETLGDTKSFTSKLVRFFKDAWSEIQITIEGLKAFFKTFWSEIRVGGAAAAAFLETAWVTFEDRFLTLVRSLQVGFDKFAAAVTTGITLARTAWNDYVAFLKGVFAHIKAILTGGILDHETFGAELNRIEAEREAKNAALNAPPAAGPPAGAVAGALAGAGWGAGAAAPAGAFAGALAGAAIGAGLAPPPERKPDTSAVDAARKKLQQAEDELARLKARAAEEAAKAARKPVGPEPEAMTPDDLDQAVEATKAKVDVAGSFSAAALAGMGAGEGVANDQLKEQKKTNDKLDKQNKLIAQNQAAFT